jgi:DNA-binding FrmR family transcriptional regulator
MKKIVNRLRRLEGQIRGLQKLLENPEDCEKIIIQFQAAKSALDGAFSELLSTNLKQCMDGRETHKIEKILKLLSKK